MSNNIRINNPSKRKRSKINTTNSSMLKALFGVYGIIGAIGIPVLGYLSLGPIGLSIGLTAAGLTSLALWKSCF